MQPSSRFLINLNGNKSFYLWNGTESYYKKLESAYTDILNDVKSEYLYFGFSMLCAATLEYSLNYILVNYCINTFGPEDYKAKSKKYMSIHFKDKLLKVTEIVSKGEFISRVENTSFKELESLIKYRNKVLHNKEFLNDFVLPINGEFDGKNVIIPIKKTEIEFKFDVATNYIDTLTKKKCISFGNAIFDFKKCIMLPFLNSEMAENSMVMKSN